MNAMACTHVFVSADRDTAIDAINPETGRSWYAGETLEQIQARYPGASIMSWDEYEAAKWAKENTPVKWVRISQARYDDLFECLPPRAVARSAFMVGEPTDHYGNGGSARFQACKEQRGRYYASSRPLTVAEFRELFGGMAREGD